MNFGSRIRAARKAAGLSQEELARRADMSLKGMGDIERGVIPDPHYSSLSKIAKGLGISIGELLEEPSSPKASAPTSSANPPSSSAATEPEHQSVESQALEALFSYVEQRIKMYEEVLKDPDNPPLSIVVSIVDLRLIAELLVEQGKLLAESMIATGRGRAAVTLSERVKQYIEELAELEKRAQERFADKHGPLDKAGLQQSLARTGGQYVDVFGEIPVGQHFNPFDITQPQQWPAATRQAAQDLWAKVQDARKRT